MNIQNIEWQLCDGIPKESDINKFEKEYGIKLPLLFKKILGQYNQGYPDCSDFSYTDSGSGETVKSGIGSLISFDKKSSQSIYSLMKDLPEFFPNNGKLIPFAEPGNGDLICFDYTSTLDNPKVSLWCHENERGSDLAIVSDNFEEFLNILKKPRY